MPLIKSVALRCQTMMSAAFGSKSSYADYDYILKWVGIVSTDVNMQERAKVALQLKHLIAPGGMGETFQALVMSRGVENEKTAGLSGLKFAR